MNTGKKYSVTLTSDTYGWFHLSYFFGRKVTTRAGRIDIKGTVKDTDGHEVMESTANDGVKITPTFWDISRF
jgi:hypothetical protein